MPSSESRPKEGSIKSKGGRAGQEDHTVTGASHGSGSVRWRYCYTFGLLAESVIPYFRAPGPEQ